MPTLGGPWGKTLRVAAAGWGGLHGTVEDELWVDGVGCASLFLLQRGQLRPREGSWPGPRSAGMGGAGTRAPIAQTPAFLGRDHSLPKCAVRNNQPATTFIGHWL